MVMLDRVIDHLDRDEVEAMSRTDICDLLFIL